MKPGWDVRVQRRKPNGRSPRGRDKYKIISSRLWALYSPPVAVVAWRWRLEKIRAAVACLQAK